MLRSPELHPNPENATPEQLLVAMEAAPNKRSHVRLSAMRTLLLGHERKIVSQIVGRTDRMVRLWIELFNRGGIDALITWPVRAKPSWSACVTCWSQYCRTGQVHWTGVKVHGYLKDKLAIELGYRTAIRSLLELNFHLRVPRAWPERQNQEERAQFKMRLETLVADPTVELWFCDESGVEGDPRPRRRWGRTGQAADRSILG